MKNYYDELEVSRYASPEVINKAYKILAKKYHPDSTTENKQQAEERFKKISEAYETLSNEKKKLAYDQTLPQEIDIEQYNNVLLDNKRLSAQILDLKAQINTLNNNYYSNQRINNEYNTHTNQLYENDNDNSNNINNTVSYDTYTYTKPKNKNYSFIDILKYKFSQLLKKIFAIFLTIVLIFIIFSILLYIPYTKNFLLNNLHFDEFFNLFN